MQAGIRSGILMSLLFVANVIHGRCQTMTLIPDATKVTFSLGATGHEVHGAFRITHGVIDLDRALAKISGSIVVSAGSGNSGDAGRDKKMHDQVLEVDRYAEITFQPQSYQGSLAPSGDSSIQVSGIFTLHGATHPLTIPMQVHLEGGRLTAKGSFVVPYVQWGLRDPSVFVLRVAKDVHIDLDLTGTVTPVN